MLRRAMAAMTYLKPVFRLWAHTTRAQASSVTGCPQEGRAQDSQTVFRPQRWAVIVNDRSGPARQRAARNRALRQARSPHTLYFETQSLAELAAAAREIRAQNIDAVALCGGDGSIGAALNALETSAGVQDALPHIALLRGGTMNTIARSIGVRSGNPAQQLARLQQRSQLGVRPCTTLAIDGRLGFLFSSGIMYGFLAAYYENGAGPLGAATLLLRVMASAAREGPAAQRISQRFEASLRCEQEAEQPSRNYLFVGAGTVQEVGLGFRPFRLAHPAAQCFHALSYTGSVRGLLRALPLFAVGHGDRLAQAQSFPCRSLTLNHPGSLPYALDGDLYQSRNPTTLRCGPLVRFLV